VHLAILGDATLTEDAEQARVIVETLWVTVMLKVSAKGESCVFPP